MFCRYCGKQIPDGSVCDCPDAVKNIKMQQRASQPKPEPQKPQQAQYRSQQQAPQRKPAKPQESNTSFIMSLVFAIAALVIYFLCRYVILGAVKGSGAAVLMVYVTYLLPVILTVVALICAVTSAVKSRHKGKGVLMMIISFLIAVFVLVSMVLMMRGDDSSEPDSPAETHAETQSDSEEAAEDTVEEPESGIAAAGNEVNPIFADKLSSYEAGLDDYVSMRTWLNGVDQTALSDSDKLAYNDLQARIEDDLEAKVSKDCNENKYIEAYDYMSGIARKLGNDAYVEKLMRDKQAGLVLYVDTEAQNIAKKDGKNAAMSFVDTSKAYITDKTMLENIIKHIADDAQPVKPTSGDLFSNDYMIPGSDSRYLSSSEISGMTAKELCYARNEIYARHNYIFKANELRQHFASKSWYYGKYTINEFNDSVFNDYEWKNIQLLRDREFALVPGGFVLDK